MELEPTEATGESVDCRYRQHRPDLWRVLQNPRWVGQQFFVSPYAAWANYADEIESSAGQEHELSSIPLATAYGLFCLAKSVTHRSHYVCAHRDLLESVNKGPEFNPEGFLTHMGQPWPHESCTILFPRRNEWDICCLLVTRIHKGEEIKLEIPEAYGSLAMLKVPCIIPRDDYISIRVYLANESFNLMFGADADTFVVTPDDTHGVTGQPLSHDVTQVVLKLVNHLLGRSDWGTSVMAEPALGSPTDRDFIPEGWEPPILTAKGATTPMHLHLASLRDATLDITAEELDAAGLQAEVDCKTFDLLRERLNSCPDKLIRMLTIADIFYVPDGYCCSVQKGVWPVAWLRHILQLVDPKDHEARGEEHRLRWLICTEEKLPDGRVRLSFINKLSHDFSITNYLRLYAGRLHRKHIEQPGVSYSKLATEVEHYFQPGSPLEREATTQVIAAQDMPGLPHLVWKHPTSAQQATLTQITQKRYQRSESYGNPNLVEAIMLTKLEAHQQSIKNLADRRLRPVSSEERKSRYEAMMTETTAHVLHGAQNQDVCIFLATELTQALLATTTPEDYLLEDLRPPHEIMRFCFPKLLQDPDGNWIECAVIDFGTSPMKDTGVLVPYLALVVISNGPKGTCITRSIHERKGSIRDFLQNAWTPYTVPECSNIVEEGLFLDTQDNLGALNPLSAGVPTLAIPAYMHTTTYKECWTRAFELCIQAVLVMNERPALLTPGRLARPAKFKQGRLLKEAIWEPNVLGLDYRLGGVSHPHGTLTSRFVRVHFRRGHWRHQAHGIGLSRRTWMWIDPVLVGLVTPSTPSKPVI